MKLAVVYNTCGISGKDNTDYYIQAIHSILNQDMDDFRVVLSSCLNKDEHIDKLKKEFGNAIDYSIINEKHTVNITFNKTVQEFIKYRGEAEGYLYIDSGCIPIQNDVISYAYNQFGSKYGMTTVQTSTDTGFDGWFGHFPQQNFLIPVGRACNLHFQIFHKDIQNRFGKIIPDIFRSFCTESVFSFVNSSINREWLVIVERTIQHWHGMDGASSGFGQKCGWQDTFEPYDIHKIISDPEGTECGFGYEECQNIKHHNRNAYDENYKCKDPERLAKFLEQNVYLSKDVLDYDTIKCEYNV